MLFDSHSHFHDGRFDADRDECLARARAAGVRCILTLGDTLEASRAAISLAEEHPEILAAAGVHPGKAETWAPDSEERLEPLLAHPRVPVLGEIGLDHYWSKDPAVHAQQELAFRAQLRMARRLGKPVSIHARDANTAVLRVLREEDGGSIGGVLHCFAGTLEEAREGIAMGFVLGVGGTCTYPKSADLRAVLKAVGPEHLIVETDAPYLPPQPQRGRRNEPAFVREAALELARLFAVPLEQLAPQLFQNTVRAFRLRPPVGIVE